MVENILNSYYAASTAEIEQGMLWYSEANDYARSLGIPLANASAVLSALSPACNWETNKRDAKALIGSRTGYKYSTYGPNVTKARNAISDPDPARLFNAKTGAKTLNFYHNILSPEDPAWVTIDRHAAAVAEGRDNSGGVRLTDKMYREYAEAYKLAAAKVGLLPCQLQAICWVQHINAMKKSDAPF